MRRGETGPGGPEEESPFDAAINVLSRIGPLHRAILKAVYEADCFDHVEVTIDRLVTRLNRAGHATSEYEVGGKVNELAKLSLVRRDASGVVVRDSPVAVIGEVS